jgi:hypothetical protein
MSAGPWIFAGSWTLIGPSSASSDTCERFFGPSSTGPSIEVHEPAISFSGAYSDISDVKISLSMSFSTGSEFVLLTKAHWGRINMRISVIVSAEYVKLGPPL